MKLSIYNQDEAQITDYEGVVDAFSVHEGVVRVQMESGGEVTASEDDCWIFDATGLFKVWVDPDPSGSDEFYTYEDVSKATTMPGDVIEIETDGQLESTRGRIKRVKAYD